MKKIIQINHLLYIMSRDSREKFLSKVANGQVPDPEKYGERVSVGDVFQDWTGLTEHEARDLLHDIRPNKYGLSSEVWGS